MRVLVCGGRGFTNQLLVNKVLGQVNYDTPIEVIVHGGARGADKCADIFAETRGIDRIIYPANWKRYGVSAGPIRNNRMLIEMSPDIVVAFAGGAGTADMIRRAKGKGIKVIEANSAAQWPSREEQ